MGSVRSKILVALIAAVSCPANSSQLRLDAIAVESADNAYIEFRLKNISDEKVCLPRAKLPWSTIYASTLTAVVLGGGQQVLNRNWIIDDPPAGDVCIDAAQQLAGRLSLEDLFPDVDTARKQHRVAIFWHYDDVDLDLDVGGYVLLERP